MLTSVPSTDFRLDGKINGLNPERRETGLISDKTFDIEHANRSYKHQYANIYFLRLHALRKTIKEKALARWKDLEGRPTMVPRVLEIVKAQLCWVVGTVYMEMPLKPNVLEDIGRDHSLPAPPPPQKIYSEHDSVMLEDESGRIKLSGSRLQDVMLVTGVIVAVLGLETPAGDFEVVDICSAGLPRPKDHDSSSSKSLKAESDDEWIAFISGLDVGANHASGSIQLLSEFLTGELGGDTDRASVANISRLIILGDLFNLDLIEDDDQDTESSPNRKSKGDQKNLGTSQPTAVVSSTLSELANVMPVHILPGPNDPSGSILPQQPFPRAMFTPANRFATLHCHTNPSLIRIQSSDGTNRLLNVNSGQPLDDIAKYVGGYSRLNFAESTLRWCHIAPTAPDTLWCHPYFSQDPFIISEAPHIYAIGNQPHFETRLFVEQSKNSSEDIPPPCRIIMVPKFSVSGQVVLVNLRTLSVKLEHLPIL